MALFFFLFFFLQLQPLVSQTGEFQKQEEKLQMLGSNLNNSAVTTMPNVNQLREALTELEELLMNSDKEMTEYVNFLEGKILELQRLLDSLENGQTVMKMQFNDLNVKHQHLLKVQTRNIVISLTVGVAVGATVTGLILWRLR